MRTGNRDNIISQSLAAQRSHVLTIVLEQGARLAVLGVMIGLAAAGLTRLMGAILYGVNATDPLTFVAVTIVLMTLIALATCYIPARHAQRVDCIVTAET